MKVLFFITTTLLICNVSAQKAFLGIGGSRIFSETKELGNLNSFYFEPGVQISKKLTPTFSIGVSQRLNESVFSPKIPVQNFSPSGGGTIDTLYNVNDQYKKMLFSFLMKFKTNLVTKDQFKLYLSPAIGAFQYQKIRTRTGPYTLTEKKNFVHFSLGYDVGFEYLLIKDKEIYFNTNFSYYSLRKPSNHEPNYNNIQSAFTGLNNDTWQLRFGLTILLKKVSEI